MKDDRIFPLTRIVLAVVIPFLLVAFLILYFLPDRSGELFAWAIKPNMTALLIGAGYLGGAYQFVFAVIDRRWHRISAAFPPVTAFTVSMLVATFLHWDRFDITHFPFQVWLILYIITPFLVPFLWLRNRVADPGTPEAQDATLPGFARLGMAGFGVAGLCMTIFMFAFPQAAILIWPWKLTPLTARVLGGWFSLLGVGGLSIARETRWSAWRVALQSFMLWAVLVLVGALRNAADFAPAGALNPFTIGTFLSILSMLAFHGYMDKRMRREVSG